MMMVNPFNTALFLGVLRGIVGGGWGPLDSHETNHNNFVRNFFSRRSCLAFTPYESMDVKDVTVVAPCTQT